MAAAAAAAAASLALSSPLRSNSRPAARFFVLCTLARTSRQSHRRAQILSTNLLNPLQLFSRRISQLGLSDPRAVNCRRLCSSTLSAESQATETTEEGASSGEKIREFRKRQRIRDIKGGPEEGLELVGQKLVVRGWVRTCRVQRSVTFIEVGPHSHLAGKMFKARIEQLI